MAKQPVVAIVTGASRGAGRGIAVALGSHGCTVYVTGRSENEGEAEVPGTIHATAREVTEAGGQGGDHYGVGIDSNIVTASIRAIVSGVNRLQPALGAEAAARAA